MRLTVCLLLLTLTGCASPRPGWVRTYPECESDAAPLRYYDVEHLFAQRTYADDPDFDINEALSGSSGPSTDLDWSYQAVWEDQSRLIREVIINGLQAQGLTAIKIKSSFQSFQITATPEVHAAIEQIIVELDEYRNSGWQTKRDIAASARSRQQEGQ